MNRGFVTFSVLLLGVGLLVGCAAPQNGDGTEIDLAAEAEAISERSAEWLAWAQQKDFDAIADNIYLPDAETMFDGTYLVGRAAIRASRGKEKADDPDSLITWTTFRIEVAASGDMAFERGSWAFDPDGIGKAGESYGQYLTLWKKLDGVWHCAFDAGTTISDN